MNQMPVPHDLGLQLPLGEGILKLLLVFLFLLHILFVNFMVGGSVLSLIFELVGLKKKKYDALAFEISKTITVNKSLAVVLGVGPLLVINLAYTAYFYSANSLTGFAWMMIIPLVIVSFLLTYLQKYTWHVWTDRLKPLHIAVSTGGMILFLFIPLIFLSNVNLMLFPDRWAEVRGFLSAMFLPNVLPRYFHFILATVAVSALFAVLWFSRKKYDFTASLPDCSRAEIKRSFFLIAFICTISQLFIGPLVLFTLPVHGLSLKLYLLITLALISAITFLYLMWGQIKKLQQESNSIAWIIILLLTTTVVIMAIGRHSYRERAISPHRIAMAEKTNDFYWKSQAAQARKRMGITKTTFSSGGEKEFETNCAACHAKEAILIGPSLVEINQLYEENIDKFVLWTKEPLVKRGGVEMPSFKHLGDEKLQSIAKYVLSIY